MLTICSIEFDWFWGSKNWDWAILIHGSCRYGYYKNSGFRPNIEKCKHLPATGFGILFFRYFVIPSLFLGYSYAIPSLFLRYPFVIPSFTLQICVTISFHDRVPNVVQAGCSEWASERFYTPNDRTRRRTNVAVPNASLPPLVRARMAARQAERRQAYRWATPGERRQNSAAGWGLLLRLGFECAARIMRFHVGVRFDPPSYI
jgi:hypothetical protein